MADTSSANIGELVLGRYRITELVGRGGVGSVYSAMDERLNRKVAVKVLHSRGKLRGAEQRMHREAQTLASLTHPNLVTLLDYDVLDDGAPAMVMEFIEGVSLGRLLRTYTFSPGEIVEVLHQTLAALIVCHEKGLVHRDLKPGNLIVDTAHSDGLLVKIIDFGIVQLVADPGATALTMSGEVFGSPRYMAPEQWLQANVDGRTDLYALGLIGYCMVLGKHFIQTRNPVMIYEAHTRGARPALEVATNGEPVPPLLAHILARASNRVPESRFQSAHEMQTALSPLMRDEPMPMPAEFLLNDQPLEESDSLDVGAVTRAMQSVSSLITAKEREIEVSDVPLDAAAPTVAMVAPLPTVAMVAPLPTVAMTAPLPDLIEPQDSAAATVAMAIPQELLDLEAAPPLEPIPTTDSVRFGVAGARQTGITNGDVERALNQPIPDIPRRVPTAPPLVHPPTGEQRRTVPAQRAWPVWVWILIGASMAMAGLGAFLLLR